MRCYCTSVGLVILEPNLQVREAVDPRNAKRFEFELYAAGSAVSNTGSLDIAGAAH